MLVQRKKDSVSKYEYGCDLRRLYPWQTVANPFWGSAIASVRPGEATTEHAHDESETFIVLAGAGRMCIGDEAENLVEGDVVLIPKDKPHSFHNLSQTDPLVFMTIFWDSPEARERITAVLKGSLDDL